ncbi:MAG: hypothetical protein Q8K83_02490 [Methylotenera sp.]|nr:hypothetical protein [Methylotenera sp.]
MKNFLIAATLATLAFTESAFAADVGVSVSIGQPGFYGRIDIGDYPYPQPRVIYRQPRVVERVYVEREPIYMRVPPGHAKNWRKHCHQYNACGERVYFVQDNWYNHDYAPHYREQHRNQGYNHNDNRRDDRHENQGYDRRDDHREHQNGKRSKH